MTIVSDKSWTIVKPHTDNFVAPVTSDDPQPVPSPPGMTINTVQMQDLQETGPAAADHFKLQLDLGVIPPGGKGRRTSLFDRYALAVIATYVGYGRWGSLAMETIARTAGCGRWQVSKAVGKEKAAGHLEVDENGKCNWYRVPLLLRRVVKLWVNPAMVRDDGYSILVACCTSYVKFRQGKNDATWFSTQECADALGVSYHTAARGLAESADESLIQKTHRPWRRSSKNEYRLTCKGKEATGVFEPESARPKARALGQTIVAEKYSSANCVRRGVSPARAGLSYNPDQDREIYELLRNIGIRWREARAIAIQRRGDDKSVRNMIIIGWFARRSREQYWQEQGRSPPHFNLAGYVIRGHNLAMAEGHDITLAKTIKAELAQGEDRARAALARQWEDPRFEQRKQEQIQRMQNTPVKPNTPYSDAELAVINSKRDKAAEAEMLRKVQDASRDRYLSSHIEDNVAKKPDL